MIVASEFLADAARELGAREVRVVPSPVELPESVGEPDEPPHVLFVGRLSPEKGIHEFLAATEGLPRVIVGAGPVRRAGGGRLRPARASSAPTTSAPRSCACPPGARATAWSRARRWRTAARSSPRAVGGLADAIEDGVTGLLVEPGTCGPALATLLDDPRVRRRLGSCGRASLRAFAPAAAANGPPAAYEDALR